MINILFLNIFFANKVAILCTVDLLCLLNCNTETIQVTEGRILVRFVLHESTSSQNSAFCHHV
jgi:hypothetical protein